MEKSTHSIIKRVAFIGNYAPRQCGIATFTTDLCESIADEYKGTACIALPVNDTEAGYEYPARVRFELTEKDVESYRRAADFLNINNVDMVSLQHEYGIFGGKAGSYILTLLRELRMPVVTTLHTILQNPNPDQRRVLKEIVALSDRVVVMSERGAEFLQSVYQVPEEKIELIPHGIPDVPFIDPSFHKDLFGVEGKHVLLSFGLLSANKGIENVISALPMILEKYPNVVYMVVGATHPHVLQNEGESYRLSLQWLARELGVDLAQVKGSEAGGRITAEDVKTFVRERTRRSGAPSGKASEDGQDKGSNVFTTQYGNERRDAITSLRRKIAATTPNGTATRLIRNTIMTVPKIAGKMPPSVFDSRGSPERNSQRRLA